MAFFVSHYEIQGRRLRLFMENGRTKTLYGREKEVGSTDGWIGCNAVFSKTSAYWTDGSGSMFISDYSDDDFHIPARWRNDTGPPYYMEEICTWNE